MKFVSSLKFRFIVFFTIFVVVLCTAISFFSIRDTIKVASEVFAIHGIDIAERAAEIIDGDAFEQLAISLDPDDPYYEKARLELLNMKNETSCEYLYTMAPFQGTVLRFIIDGSAPPEDTENFSALGDEEDTADYDPAFERCWTEKSIQYGRLEFQEGWGWMVSIYAPIVNSRGIMVGIVGCDFDGENLYAQIRAEVVRQIIIAFVFLLIGAGFLLFFIKMIFGRIEEINGHLKGISKGGSDLTERIKLRHNDEIGELGGHFNETMEKINHLVASIKLSSDSLSGIGTGLSQNMNETAEAIKKVTETIQAMKEQVINQSASVTETGATMEQVSKNIDLLNTHVEMQTASVSQSSSAIEEMLANIESVTKTLVNNAGNVNKLTAASEEGRAGLEGVSRDIQEIAKESEGLLEINLVMENIASMTNLLSMNAAIEAAHAGESGKGFAVVAAEIRKLATNSSDQSRIISDTLKKIKTSIDKITGSTDTVRQDFEAIDSLVKTVAEQEENIRNAMEEQGQGSQQILEAIGKLNELTQRVKAGSGEMLEGSIEVIKESRNLETITRKVSGSIGDMAADADLINAAVYKVNGISRSNKEHIDALVSEVSQFKV